MAGTFVKTTLRNFYREKIYAVINVAGLSLAIACCLILGLYLHGELTYDQHNTRYKELYRVANEFDVNGKLETFATTSQLLGPMLTEDYAEVKGFVRIFMVKSKILLKHEDKAFYWDRTGFASQNLFEVLDHEILHGDPEKLKTERFCAVSETFAKKYWGNENPIGKTISSDRFSENITHVFADLPENSHLKYDVIQTDDIPFFAVPDNVNARAQRLTSPLWYTYLIMDEDYNIQDFKEISDSFYERHMERLLESANITWRAWLQPMADIHYNSNVGGDEPTGNKNYVYGFAAVAIFILLVACINYMNLATARAAKRAKEVGMQKILGSGRTRLIFQFLTEAIFYSLIAMAFGYVLVLVALTQTPISGLLDHSIAFKDLFEPQLIGWILLFSLALGLLSGSYPAFYLSSIAPLSALVESQQSGKGSIRLRKILVLIQFIISITVIACTLFMAMQMHYVTNKPLGFDKENKVKITLRTADVIDKVPTLKKELLKNSNILGVTLSDRVIGGLTGGIRELFAGSVDNEDGGQDIITSSTLRVDKDFFKVMGIELVEGRDFSRRLLTDVGDSYIVNQKMVQKMGWEQPLSKHIGIGRVIGVVKDFHYGSLHIPVDSFVFQQIPDLTNVTGENREVLIFFLTVNIAGEGIFETLDFLDDKMAEFDPKHPFEFEFLDDFLHNLYQDEQRLMSLTGIFAAVCIFISCMGLFGLASFTTEQRTKEIGIRKVLGASVGQIITMLARHIMLLVLIGALIGSVIAYLAIYEWLSEFEYHINMNMNSWVFLLSAAVAAAVAYVTIALQSLKTAQANPINALRYE